MYIEQYDNNSKYERRPIKEFPVLTFLSLSQFVKMYNPSWGKKEQEKNNESDEEEVVPLDFRTALLKAEDGGDQKVVI